MSLYCQRMRPDDLTASVVGPRFSLPRPDLWSTRLHHDRCARLVVCDRLYKRVDKGCDNYRYEIDPNTNAVRGVSVQHARDDGSGIAGKGDHRADEQHEKSAPHQRERGTMSIPAAQVRPNTDG